MSGGDNSDDRLQAYREKRDFRRTGEPSGENGVSTDNGEEDRIFVIQEHRASSHHWDFRLEVDGVLTSWAVPKGPSTDPSDKRLALPTEDHPMDYADFEGRIPEGEYGAGPVIVWDRGTYRNLQAEKDGTSMVDALRDGHVEVWLEGQKLRGGYALVQADLDYEDDAWLLVKMDDEGADARRNPTSTEPESVVSGKTLDEVA